MDRPIALSILSFIFLGILSCAPDYTEDECPVVGNTESGIYHVPGGEFYEMMLRKNRYGDNRECFDTEEEAKAAGYRESLR